MKNIYLMYRFTKLVDEECDKEVKEIFRSIKQRDTESKPFRGVNGVKIAEKFEEKRILFKKLSVYKCSQITSLATHQGYVVDVKGHKGKVIVDEKGVKLIEGFPFIRFGLWKAWYDEHGWLIPVIPAGAVGAIITFLVK